MIPGVTYHPRATWEDPKQPVNQPGVYVPPRHNLAMVEHVIAHYTAADDLIDGDPGEHASDLPAYLRAIQRDYRKRHGFSIGYSWAIDWLGGVWELRGWEYRPAATGGRLVPQVGNFNAITFAILCLVDGNDPLTSYAVESFRRIMAEIERRCGEVDIWPHSRADPTGCCGDGIRAQIAAGQLEPSITEPAPIPPEYDMTPFLWRDERYANVFLVEAANAITIDAATRDRALAEGVKLYESVHDQMLKSCAVKAGLVYPTDLRPIAR